MKTSLDILTKDKQEELHRVVEIIREELEPEMIILFGSHDVFYDNCKRALRNGI